MQKVLDQQEIDAMVSAARGSSSAAVTNPKSLPAERWDVRQAGRIGRDQLQTITALHETFARNLTHSLGAYLRVVFTTTLVSAEHLTYREFLQGVPETTFIASCRLDPTGHNAALQLDLKVAFPIIDLLLGGEGKPVAAMRELTDIEEQILESVARIICRELGAAWQALPLEVVFEERLQAGEAQRLMPPDEKTLALSFEVTIADVRGSLILALPGAVSNSLLRKIAGDRTRRRSRAASEHRRQLMRKLLDCPFDVELAATAIPLTVNTVATLRPGMLLSCARPATEPAELLVAGTSMFQAVPARSGTRRSARVIKVHSGLSEDPADEEKRK